MTRQGDANPAPTLSVIEAARLSARRNADQLICVGPGAAPALGVIVRDAEALAAGLWNLGLRPGDVVSFQLPNWPEALVINLAASALGLVCSPLVPIYRGAELKFMLGDSGSKAVFIPEHFAGFDYAAMYEGLTPDLPDSLHVIRVRSAGMYPLTYETILQTGLSMGQIEAPAPSIGDLKLLLYTSGTTGKAKSVRHSQRTLFDAMQRSVDTWGLQSGDRIFMPSPVTHATGYVNALEMPFFFGTQVVLMDRWDADMAVRLIDEFQATATVGATPFLKELTEAAIKVGSRLTSLRIFACGGAAVPPDVIYRANEVMACKPAFRVYGSSEAPYVTLGFPATASPELAARTDGRVVGYDVRILDDNGGEAPTGASGEIAVRGASLFLGYGNAADAASVSTDDGYFLTGDIGALRSDGGLVITDRKKDIIIRGGENISAREVEDALAQVDAISEAAVVAMPHDRLGEGVCAFVVLKPNHTLTLQEIVEFLMGLQIARQKYPERLFILESLPRTASGKVRKDLLRRRAAEQDRIEESMQ